jgi:hypothetical protein
MKLTLIIISLCFCAIVLAAAQPIDRSQAQAIDRENDMISHSARMPIWNGLKQMTADEKANSQIQIELPATAGLEARELAGTIEELWNSRHYNEALSGFGALAQMVNLEQIAIGNNWRTPVPTEDFSLWGTDVRIGNRDSAYVTALDVHRATGTLFAVLVYREGSAYYFSVNRSTNNGSTWSETATWGAVDSLRMISAAVMGNHCLVAYTCKTDPFDSRIRRYRYNTGLAENFNDGATYKVVYTSASPDSVKEVSLISNQDYYNNRLYYSIITKQGSLLLFWADTAAITWNQLVTGVTTAKRGLSSTCNEGYAAYYAWFSYINNGDTLCIAKNSPFSSSTKFYIGASTYCTSIGAYEDTVTCAFEYLGYRLYCRYLVSYNGGTSWSIGSLSDTATTSESPALAARDDGGVGVIYRYYTPTRQERYTWRNYTGGWTTPIAITNYEPYWNRPAIEYLGSNRYGVVYLSNTSPIRAAYFDLSTASGIDQKASLPKSFMVARNYPNPFNASTCITFDLPKSTQINIDVFDILGRKVETIFEGYQQAGQHKLIWNADNLSSGVYFARLSTAEESQTLKMVLLK